MEEVTSGHFDWSADYSHRLVVCEGEVDLIFTRKLASGFLEGPCVRTNYDIPHGLSGGPALDERGYVAGVNSAGASEIFGQPSSLLSVIYSAIQNTSVNLLDSTQTVPVRPRILDLVLQGKIRADESEQLLGFSGAETEKESEAVHPMIHVDDYEFAYESLAYYTDKKPALATSNHEKLRRILYQYRGKLSLDQPEGGHQNES